MIRRTPRSTRNDTLFPYTTLLRSLIGVRQGEFGQGGVGDQGRTVSYETRTVGERAAVAGRDADLDPVLETLYGGDRVDGIPLDGAWHRGVRGHLDALRSEERRVGKECVSTCRSRWSPYH